MHLWKDRQSHEGIITHPLVAFALQNTFEDSRSNNYHWDFQVPPQTVFNYIGQVLAWNRLCMLEDPHDNFKGTDYWTSKVLVFDALQESWGAEATIGFGGPLLFDALATPLDAPRDSDAYKTAHKLVWRLLTRSSLQKITHGKGLTKTVSLGVLLDEPQNADKDHQAGTFAELLRYGTVHFEQTRESIAYVKAEKAPLVLNKGMIEP